MPPGGPPSPSLARWGAMCDIVTDFEVPPLIFFRYRNRPNRGSTDEPRGSMTIAASSGSSSQDTEDLQAIKLKV